MTAIISDCGKYRYLLEREVSMFGKGTLLFIMLNPSTADASKDDPTIRKCMGFAERLGFARFQVVNLFAYRATDPDELRGMVDAFGPQNDLYVRNAINSADKVICAWGTKGVLHGADQKMKKWLEFWERNKVFALELTKDGHPKHPLYVPYSAQIVEFCVT